MLRGIAGSLLAAQAALALQFGVTPQLKHSVLYVEGVFDNSYDLDTMRKHAEDVAASGFNRIILAFLHVHTRTATEGDGASAIQLYYNNVPFENVTHLPEILGILRGPTSHVKSILISIGGAGNGNDFELISQYWGEFNASFTRLMTTLGLDGVDIDYEGSLVRTTPAEAAIDAAVNRTMRLAAERDWMFTSSSTSSWQYWLPFLHWNRNASSGLPAMAWFNLQTYGDSGAASGAARRGTPAIDSEYTQFVNGLEKAFPGWPNPVLMGSDVEVTSSAAEEARKMKEYVAAVPSIPGAFIWDYRLIACVPPPPNGTAAQYAAAIRAAYG